MNGHVKPGIYPEIIQPSKIKREILSIDFSFSLTNPYSEVFKMINVVCCLHTENGIEFQWTVHLFVTVLYHVSVQALPYPQDDVTLSNG